MARPDFRSTAAQRLSEERELSPAIINLLSPLPEGARRTSNVRQVPVARIDPSPDQPRLVLDKESLTDLAASIKEHGVLQPILVRPLPGGRYQLVAGERRWRASMLAGLDSIPALVAEIEDEIALEISIIENLQREDLSPLEEASMYQRMTQEHGYSVRKLAQKLGKDKGYIENRLRLADAPAEIRDLVSVRKDTISHAYELLKVSDPRRRRRLAEQVARGDLSLAKLRSRIEGRQQPDETTEAVVVPARPGGRRSAAETRTAEAPSAAVDEIEESPELEGPAAERPVGEDALVGAKTRLNDALGDLMTVLRSPSAPADLSDTDRANLAKYLTIAKLRLENAIALLRAGEPRERH